MPASDQLPDAISASLAEQTLCGAFQITARRGGTQTALRTFGGDEVVSWEQYDQRVRTIAAGLHSLGVRADDTVALLLRNRPVFNVVDTAVLHLGAVPFSIYHTEPVEQMLALVEDSGARVIVTEPAFLEKVRAVLQGAARVEHVVVDGEDPDGAEREISMAAVEQMHDERFDFDAAWRRVTEDSIATLVYTSGTTGKPKAVQIPHRAIIHSLRGVQRLAPATVGHLGVSFLPAAHITDRFICHYTTIGLGGTLTCVPDPDGLWDAIVETRPTRFFGVPRTYEKLAERAKAVIGGDPELQAALAAGTERVRAEQAGRTLDPEQRQRAAKAYDVLAPVREFLGLDQAEWIAVAAAPSSYEVLEFHHSLGLKLAELWGMTECMMATMNPPDRIKLGTVGIPLPSVQARLGEDGELLLRGAHACSGYRNDPEQTRAMRGDDGWLRSGDLASIDGDGYISIVGRKKEQMINSSGKNLFPVKIENAIMQASPLLGHVAAIGDRRRYVTALIVLDPGRLQSFAAEHGLSGDRAELVLAPEVQAEVARAVTAGNERLSRVEQVRSWKVLDADWPPGGEELTNTLKLRRGAIDEKYAHEIEALYA
jgi:long-subunit acyl-CoA synthetase (AMP-forming)